MSRSGVCNPIAALRHSLARVTPMSEALVLWAIIIGLIVGALAKFIMPGRDPGGIIVTILIGIAGSFIGTMIGRALGLYRQGQGAGFIMSLLGAILLLWIYRMIVSRRATS
jgi:uncharacterized membrane protein YeaQ/YmgE (transglycosylase-associated protein family)